MASTVKDDCLIAFKNKDRNEAVRLLPLLVEQINEVHLQKRRGSIKTGLSSYTISISSIDPWYKHDVKAGLLHLSSRNGWFDITKKLIEQYELDPRVRDKEGNICLHYAAAGNQLEVVKYFATLSNFEGLQFHSNKLGAIPLHIAAANGSLDVMKYLIEIHHYNMQCTDRSNRTFLHYGFKHINIVKYLITGCNYNPVVTDKNGKTVLHHAVEQNHLAVVEYLVLTGKCDPILTANEYGNTVLYYAIDNESFDIVKYLICHPMATEWHIPHQAVKDINIVKCLITECLYDPIATDRYGNTILHYAVQNNHLAVVEYLLSTGKCDPILAANKYGNTVLSFAIAKKSFDVLKYLTHLPKANELHILHQAVKHNIDDLKYLITERNCDPMVTDEDGKTVLHCAVEMKCLDVVEYLLSTGKCDPILAANEYGNTVLLFAAPNGSLDTMKYLIHNHECDPMFTDKDGKTVLHYAVKQNSLDVVEYLLSTGKCDPVAKDNEGRTPLQLTNDYNRQKVHTLFIKFGQVKTSHPVDSYVNVLLMGNPGAGKSTLSKVINDTVTGSVVMGSLRKVKGVEPFTAGIIPYKLQHKKLGNIILHDFAGHPEYYSSHSAVIENLLQGSAGVFLIVVNILEKEAVKQLHQWLTVVKNEVQKALHQCHVIVVVSHVDEISDPVEKTKRKEEIQLIIGRERSVFLDCRKLGGSDMGSFFKKLSSACESIRSTSGRNLSLYCHMMYGLLEERKENILTLSDVMSAAKDNDSYVLPDEREEVLDVLHSLDSIGLIKVLKSEDKVWVVVNKGILLFELDGILFAPKTFKEHVDIASNTGIVSVSGLTRLFPHYDPDMLICFLKHMGLCQEISSLRMTNLIPLERGERLLFFPCLLHSDRPDEMTSQVYQFGWCLQCTGEHHFFPPQYFHILSLNLAFKLALPQEDDKLNHYCKFWKNGLHWSNGHGVRALVEIVNDNQCVLVLLSYEEGYKMVELRRKVIGEVISAYKESSPSLEVKELVIDPKELDYPVNTPRERTVYSVKEILSAIDEGRPCVVTDDEQTEVKSILPDESLVDINKISLLGGRDIKVRTQCIIILKL